MLSTPLWFTQPDRIWSPAFTSRGALSPVRATVSRLEVPSRITPSIGTFSPGRITIVSPTATSPGLTTTISPFFSRLAVSGRMSSIWEMALELLPSAIPSKSSPTWKNSMTKTASANCSFPPGTKPIRRAPIVAMHIRKSSLNISPFPMLSPASFRTSKPATRYGTR